jgi:ribosomal-protein-alanine N-acetyltransferase
MMPVPILESERLQLRAFDRTDAADVFAYASSPNVSRYTTWQTHRSIADSHGFIDMVLKREPNQMTWAICLREQTAVVGAIEFGPCDAAEAQIDYVLAESLWNKGLMTEAFRLVMNWGLQQFSGIKSVVSGALAQNIASQRVMEKNGLAFDHIRIGNWSKFDEPVEVRYYKFVRP